MAHWNLYMGSGSFTLKPIDFIEDWPYDPSSEPD